MVQRKSCPSEIGPINLGTKQTGAPSAGNPHAGCDVAGAGNGFTVWLLRHSQRKRGAMARLDLRNTAPVLDPTPRVRHSKLAKHQLRTVPKAEEAPASREPLLSSNLIFRHPPEGWISLLYLYCTFNSHLPNTPKYFGMNGGDDGARTRDLCRDRPAF
jgi:hypothetical protein